MIKVYSDPSVVGVAAHCGECACFEPSGVMYIKVDTGDTDWELATVVYAGGPGGGPHASDHQNGGSDEVNVAGLSGQMADAQPSTIALVSGLTAALAGKEDTGTAAAAVAAHAAASDPHTGYQRESEKGAANGYASLGAGGLVPIAQLASGTPNGAKFVRDDNTLATPPSGSGNALEVTVDFGTGDDLATTTVTGQAWVTGTSVIVAQVFGSTSDHDAEDAVIEQLKVTVANRVVGDGFDVIAHAPYGTHGQYLVHCVGV